MTNFHWVVFLILVAAIVVEAFMIAFYHKEKKRVERELERISEKNRKWRAAVEVYVVERVQEITKQHDLVSDINRFGNTTSGEYSFQCDLSPKEDEDNTILQFFIDWSLSIPRLSVDVVNGGMLIDEKPLFSHLGKSISTVADAAIAFRSRIKPSIQ